MRCLIVGFGCLVLWGTAGSVSAQDPFQDIGTPEAAVSLEEPPTPLAPADSPAEPAGGDHVPPLASPAPMQEPAAAEAAPSAPPRVRTLPDLQDNLAHQLIVEREMLRAQYRAARLAARKQQGISVLRPPIPVGRYPGKLYRWSHGSSPVTAFTR